MIQVEQEVILPDGTQATRKGRLYIIKNTIINAVKIKEKFPSWTIPYGDIKLAASVAEKVFAWKD